MKLFVVISLLIVGSVSADFLGDILEVADDTFIFPCFTKLNCEFRDKREYAPMEKCIKEATEEDIQMVADYLQFGDISKVDDAPEKLAEYYCSLHGKTQEKRFNNVLKGLVQYFEPNCPSKFGKALCQHRQNLGDCILQATETLYDDGKCDA